MACTEYAVCLHMQQYDAQIEYLHLSHRSCTLYSSKHLIHQVLRRWYSVLGNCHSYTHHRFSQEYRDEHMSHTQHKVHHLEIEKKIKMTAAIIHPFRNTYAFHRVFQLLYKTGEILHVHVCVINNL